jgi:hypothetical protein
MSKQICVPYRNEYRSQQNYAPSFPSPRKTVAIKRNTEALLKYGKAADSSVTDLLNTSAGYTIKSVIAELERRRAKFFALACAAEARAQEAEKKYEQAENRLEQEINQRLVAEQRLREFEENLVRQLQDMEIERVKTLEVVRSQREVEARLKKAERRIKEAENDTTSLTLALAKAYQKRAEAEAFARAAEEKAHKIETLFLRAEAGPDEATEGNLKFGFLIFESRRKMLEIERDFRKVEARHRQQADTFTNSFQKQDVKPLAIHEKEPLAEEEFTSHNLRKSDDDDHACPVAEQKGLGAKLKFFIYCMAISVILGACWGLVTVFLEI